MLHRRFARRGHPPGRVIRERSGGLGGILGLAHEYASTDKTNRSYELWARYVAPRFQGQIATLEENCDWIEGSLAPVFGNVGPALARAYEDAGKPVPGPIAKALEAAAAGRGSAADGLAP